MTTYRREIAPSLREAARHFGALVVTGPRRAGKTFLLRHTFPKDSYHLLEDPDLLGRVQADPRGWLDEVKTPAILDEIQNVPELLPYIRSRIDGAPRRKGQWLLTGSQQFSLMKGVTDSMTGRAAVFELLPLSQRESGNVDLLNGGFPEVLLHPSQRDLWFRSYVQTYLERDVRAVKPIRDLVTFRRFLAYLATRHGQLLNKTDLGAPLGISVPTVGEWLSILEITGHILLVPPYLENFGKRLVKSPRVYLVDCGLACHFLGITRQAELEKSPFLGPILEGFVASEIVKNQVNAGRSREIYFFRDEQGLEVDLLFPGAGGSLVLAEIKATRTVHPAMAAPLARLSKASGLKNADAIFVHRRSPTSPVSSALLPGVRSMDIVEFLNAYPNTAGPRRRRLSR